MNKNRVGVFAAAALMWIAITLLVVCGVMVSWNRGVVDAATWAQPIGYVDAFWIMTFFACANYGRAK